MIEKVHGIYETVTPVDFAKAVNFGFRPCPRCWVYQTNVEGRGWSPCACDLKELREVSEGFIKDL